MSKESLQKIEDAIRDHMMEVKAQYQPVISDWFVSYGCMCHDKDSPTGIAHGINYITSDSSPHGAYGVGKIGLKTLEADLVCWSDTSDTDDEDEPNIDN